MQLGIFAKTFSRPTVEEVLDAVRAYRLDCVQFNMTCAGLPPLPDAIEPSLVARISTAATSSGVKIAAVSGTYNMIHPDNVKFGRNLSGIVIWTAKIVHTCNIQ